MPRTKAEIGATGLPLFSGRLSLDTNTRLRWPAAGRIYRDMLDNEPAVGALRTAVQTLLRDDMQVTPGGPTAADQRAADHVAMCLQDMRHPLGTAIRQLAGAWFYGFSLQEQVLKRRPDGTVGWDAWALRRQETLDRWETDARGRVSGFTQRPAPDYVLRTIPMSRLIHVVADDSESSPEGRGCLRGMYRHWFFVQNIEILFGIALERFGTGMPRFKRTDSTPAAVLTRQQEDDLAAQAERIRQNEQAYIFLPPGIDFDFLESPGLNAETYLNAIQAYRIWMLSVSLAEFIALGTGTTGSFALGESKIDLFLQALTGLQTTICAAINRQAIPRLMAANGWQVAMPLVSLPAVRKYDLEKIGGFAKLLATIGAFHATPEDEAWFRAISDLHDIDVAELEELHEAGRQQDAREERAAAQADQDEEAPVSDDEGSLDVDEEEVMDA